MKQETVFITGGAGFIGSHIVDRLIAEGYRVVVIDNLATGKKSNVHHNAIFYQCDITDPDLALIFEKERPAFVSHHAAQAAVRHSVEDPLLDGKINVLGTIHVLHHCIQYGVKKFIFASSGGAVYGEQKHFPASESHDIDPLSPYGISKLSGEHYVRYFERVHGLPYAILRYANVYGPRQDPFGEAGVIAIFIQQMLNGDQPLIHGDGEQTRDFIHIDDVVEANLLAMRSGSSDIFNIGTGVETSVNQIFDHLKAFINPAMEKKYDSAKPGEQRRSVIDAAKARKWLQWFPRVSLEKGLKKTVEHFTEPLKKQ